MPGTLSLSTQPDHFPHIETANTEPLQNTSILSHLWTMTRGGTTVKETVVEKVGKRRVRFQTSVRVILIPSRPEYIAAGLLPVLWWEKTDFPRFKTAAVSEVISLMQLRNIKNCKEAMKLLYQTDLNADIDPASSETDPDSTDIVGMIPSDDDDDNTDTELPKSCLKPHSHIENAIKRPISWTGKEDRFNHVQRHLHPLAYMCD